MNPDLIQQQQQQQTKQPANFCEVTNERPVALSPDVGSDAAADEAADRFSNQTFLVFDNPLHGNRAVIGGGIAAAAAAAAGAGGAVQRQDSLLLAHKALGSSLLQPWSSAAAAAAAAIQQPCGASIGAVLGDHADGVPEQGVRLGHRRTVSFDRECPSISAPLAGRSSPTASRKTLFRGATSIDEERPPLPPPQQQQHQQAEAPARQLLPSDPSFFICPAVVHTIVWEGGVGTAGPSSQQPQAISDTQAGELHLRRTITTDSAEVDSTAVEPGVRITGRSPLSPAVQATASIFADGAPSDSSSNTAGADLGAPGPLPSFRVRRTVTTDSAEVDAPSVGPEGRLTGRSPLSPATEAPPSIPFSSFSSCMPAFDIRRTMTIEEGDEMAAVMEEACGSREQEAPAPSFVSLLPDTSLDEQTVSESREAAAAAAVLQEAHQRAQLAEAYGSNVSIGSTVAPEGQAQVMLRRTVTIEDDMLQPVLVMSASGAAGLHSQAAAAAAAAAAADGAAGAGGADLIGAAGAAAPVRLRRTETIEEGEQQAQLLHQAAQLQQLGGLAGRRGRSLAVHLRRTETIEEGGQEGELLSQAAAAMGGQMQQQQQQQQQEQQEQGSIQLRRTVTIEEGDSLAQQQQQQQHVAGITASSGPFRASRLRHMSIGGGGSTQLQLRRTVTIEEGQRAQQPSSRAAPAAAAAAGTAAGGNALAMRSSLVAATKAAAGVQLRRTITIEESEVPAPAAAAMQAGVDSGAGPGALVALRGTTTLEGGGEDEQQPAAGASGPADDLPAEHDSVMPFQPAAKGWEQLCEPEEGQGGAWEGAAGVGVQPLGSALGQKQKAGPGGLAGPVLLHIRAAARTRSDMEEPLTPQQLAVEVQRQLGMGMGAGQWEVGESEGAAAEELLQGLMECMDHIESHLLTSRPAHAASRPAAADTAALAAQLEHRAAQLEVALGLAPPARSGLVLEDQARLGWLVERVERLVLRAEQQGLVVEGEGFGLTDTGDDDVSDEIFGSSSGGASLEEGGWAVSGQAGRKVAKGTAGGPAVGFEGKGSAHAPGQQWQQILGATELDLM